MPREKAFIFVKWLSNLLLVLRHIHKKNVALHALTTNVSLDWIRKMSMILSLPKLTTILLLGASIETTILVSWTMMLSYPVKLRFWRKKVRKISTFTMSVPFKNRNLKFSNPAHISLHNLLKDWWNLTGEKTHVDNAVARIDISYSEKCS